MGTTMKKSIFDDQTSKALMNWHNKAKKKKPPTKPGAVEVRKLGSPGGSPETSPRGKAAEKTSKVEPLSQTANIVASVDIPEEKPHKNPDLL